MGRDAPLLRDLRQLRGEAFLKSSVTRDRSLVGCETRTYTTFPRGSTAMRTVDSFIDSDTYRYRTFRAQSGALENVGLREQKFGLTTKPAVGSFRKEARKYWRF